VFIDVQHLGKTYRTRENSTVEALDDVCLSVEKGEFLCVVGPSGCGKTTLLKILAGLLDATSGEIRLDGQPLDRARQTVGIVFQNPVLLPWLTILENVLVPARVLKLDLSPARSRAHELLDLVGLRGFAGKYPRELSTGMQQRAAIARALVHEPPLLLMDEPFAALDAMTREQMNLELLRIWEAERKTIFFITHSIPEAIFLGDHTVVMSPRPGRIVEILEPPLPRPRTLDVMGDPVFGAYTKRARQLLNASHFVGD
jgi:NitT/TauT family transport system ATP-binding protein